MNRTFVYNCADAEGGSVQVFVLLVGLAACGTTGGDGDSAGTGGSSSSTSTSTSTAPAEAGSAFCETVREPMGVVASCWDGYRADFGATDSPTSRSPDDDTPDVGVSLFSAGEWAAEHCLTNEASFCFWERRLAVGEARISYLWFIPEVESQEELDGVAAYVSGEHHDTAVWAHEVAPAELADATRTIADHWAAWGADLAAVSYEEDAVSRPVPLFDLENREKAEATVTAFSSIPKRVAEDCLSDEAEFCQIAEATFGADPPADDPDTLEWWMPRYVGLLERETEVAPAEVRDDVELLSDAWAEVVRLGDEVDWDAGELEGLQEEVGEEFGVERLEAASDAERDWLIDHEDRCEALAPAFFTVPFVTGFDA